MTSTLTRRPLSTGQLADTDPSIMTTALTEAVEREDAPSCSPPPPSPPPATMDFTESELNGLKLKPLKQPEPLTTKVYYYVDNQEVPYSVEVPVPPSRVSLADFKSRILIRPCKAYCKNFDEAIGREVKADILDEDAPLRPNADGRFELFLLCAAASGSGGAPVAPSAKSNRVSMRGMPELATVTGGYARHRVSAPAPAYLDDSTSMDESSSYFGTSNMRVLSDGDDSQSDFLSSISQQYGDGMPPSLIPVGLRTRYSAAMADNATRQRCRRQQKRYTRRASGAPPPLPPAAVAPLKRRSYSSSFLSTTIEDTELSMALNLITVTIRLDAAAVRKRPFGMSVRAQQYAGSWYIVVHDVAEKSIVALDGRIKPGYTILYVNDVALEDYPPDHAIDFIKKELQRASQRSGHVTFTCVQGDELADPRTTLSSRLPAEPVRPIDPHAWVEHCNIVNGLRIINEEAESQMSRTSTAATSALPTVPYPVGSWPAPSAVLPLAPKSSSAPTSNATVSGGAGEAHAAAGGPSSGVGSSIASSGRKSPAGAKTFHAEMDSLALVCAMADPLCGLRLRNRAFLGCELLEWLARNVRGLEEERARRDFASTLLRDGYILQAVTRKEFTQQCYYTFNEQLMSKLAGLNTIKRGALTLIQNPAAAQLNSSDELTFSTIASGDFDAPAPAAAPDGAQLPVRRRCKNAAAAGRGGGFFRRALREFFCFPIRTARHAVPSTPKYTPVRRPAKKALKKTAGDAPAVRHESTHIP